MKKLAVIANPQAGPGRSRLGLDQASDLLRGVGFQVTKFPTTGPGHATELASNAAADHDAVVAVGGDGTVHEVAKGLAGKDCPLGVLPSGSGNDFAMGLGCPTAELGLAAIKGGRVISCDAGHLNEQFFVNSLGLLASGLVSLRAVGLWRWLGRKRYLVASVRTLLGYRGQNVTWVVQDKMGSESLSGRWLLAEICNGPSTGGGFRFAPEADFSSGVLDACLIRPVGLLTGLKLLGPASRGERLEHPAINLRRSGRITFTTAEPVGYHVDGEPGMLPPGEHTITIAPSCLKVLVPEE